MILLEGQDKKKTDLRHLTPTTFKADQGKCNLTARVGKRKPEKLMGSVSKSYSMEAKKSIATETYSSTVFKCKSRHF